uniref:glucuronosyltransferase n=1 Tax=Globodera rostochiensis TaxID=31243 RepID=A0A914HVZ2_GLORO
MAIASFSSCSNLMSSMTKRTIPSLFVIQQQQQKNIKQFIPNKMTYSSSHFLIKSMLLITTIIAVCIIIIVLPPNDAAGDAKRRLKVLVYSPTLTWSHMQFMGTIADTLTEAGHQVHFMRLIPNNFTISWPKEVHKVQKIHDIRQMFAENSINIQQLSILNDPFDDNAFPTFFWQSDGWTSFMNFSANLCRELTWNNELIRHFEAEQFDVAIAEIWQHLRRRFSKLRQNNLASQHLPAT